MESYLLRLKPQYTNNLHPENVMSHSRIGSFKEKDFASTADRDELAIKFVSPRLGAALMFISACISVSLIYLLLKAIT